MKVLLTLREGLPQGTPLEVRLEGDEVRGIFRHTNPVLGEVVLPFAARLEGDRLLALPLPPPCLEVEGRVRSREEGLELHLELRLRLPESPKWGERALGRILQHLFARSLERALSQPVGSPV